MDAAMNSAVSALQAQSSALSTVSDNLANSQTTGYKAISTQFNSLLTQQAEGISYPAGGVQAVTRQNVLSQGLIQSTTSSTDLAINGNGMFPVTYGANTAQTFFTRNGAFNPDSKGNLQLTGTNYYLTGWPTDASGKVLVTNPDNLASLQTVNISRINTSAVGTSNYSLQANLPAEAPGGFTQNTSMAIYDSLGVQHSLPVTWTKGATVNTWTMSVGDPTDPAGAVNAGKLSTSPAPSAYTVTFNPDGSLGSIVPDGANPGPMNGAGTMPQLSVTAWNDGASASSIALNLGTPGAIGVGKTDGLSQFDTGETTPMISVKTTSQDGVQYGQLTGVAVDSTGTVIASYDNGQKVPIFKIPVATFPNENGLRAQTDGVYAQSGNSGTYLLNQAGTSGAGTVEGSALEGSTVNTAQEFSNMIAAQQAYSSASQVIGTDKQMFQSLLQVIQ